MNQSATTLTLVTEQGHDVATAITLIVLTLIALAFWAGAEFQLRRPANQEPLDEDRDAIATVIGLVDKRRTPETDAAFADMLEYRLRRRNEDERGLAGDETFLVGAVILALFFVAVLAVTR